MTNTEREPTKEEIAQARAKTREIALRNLNKHLVDLATAYYAHKEDSGYGKNDNYAVHDFLYKPSLKGATGYDLKSGEEVDLIYQSLLDSRKDGRLYSGQVGEEDIIKTSAGIIQNSLEALKVEDIMGLVGSEIAVKDAYKGKYITELATSENEEDKALVQQLIGGFQAYMTTQGVSKALGQRAGKIRGNLENLVKEEEKQK